MAKRKPVTKVKAPAIGDGTVTFSSGVTVKLVSLAPGLHRRIVQRTLQDFPDPAPPEEDGDQADYVRALKEARRQRANRVGEAILDFCVILDLTPWEPTITRLERYAGQFPEDPDERRLEFLTSYALQTAGDYDMAMMGIARLAMHRDPDLAAEIEKLQTDEEIDLAT